MQLLIRTIRVVHSVNSFEINVYRVSYRNFATNVDIEIGIVFCCCFVILPESAHYLVGRLLIHLICQCFNSVAVDKEARLKCLKEKQNEERQRKLEEIKAQALAAQRFKEQKEQERRKRLEELKGKEDVRRQQVEERKRAIVQAEQVGKVKNDVSMYQNISIYRHK